jgi:hypothetical protein
MAALSPAIPITPRKTGWRRPEPPTAVIASAAKQSMPLQRKYGLLRRFAPLPKRFAFVAGNDGT